ncbi:hypothetical protein B0H13DRAFT_146553 [Mycena leptocephala]|nr:hypothetical protein B0H13DRAFT_146553 [Mycena leptocephala]
MAQMDAGMGRDEALLNDSEVLRAAIIAEIFLLKIDASTITLAHLLQHLAATRAHARLLGPESGMREYARAALFGTFGVPLRVYPGLKINFISPPSSAPYAPSPRTSSTSLTPSDSACRPSSRSKSCFRARRLRGEPPYDSADVCGDFWVGLDLHLIGTIALPVLGLRIGQCSISVALYARIQVLSLTRYTLRSGVRALYPRIRSRAPDSNWRADVGADTVCR